MEKQALFTLLKLLQNAGKYAPKARQLRKVIGGANKDLANVTQKIEDIGAGKDLRGGGRRFFDTIFHPFTSREDLIARYGSKQLPKLTAKTNELNELLKTTRADLRSVNTDRLMDLGKAAPVALTADAAGAYLTDQLANNGRITDKLFKKKASVPLTNALKIALGDAAVTGAFAGGAGSLLDGPTGALTGLGLGAGVSAGKFMPELLRMGEKAGVKGKIAAILGSLLLGTGGALGGHAAGKAIFNHDDAAKLLNKSASAKAIASKLALLGTGGAGLGYLFNGGKDGAIEGAGAGAGLGLAGTLLTLATKGRAKAMMQGGVLSKLLGRIGPVTADITARPGAWLAGGTLGGAGAVELSDLIKSFKKAPEVAAALPAAAPELPSVAEDTVKAVTENTDSKLSPALLGALGLGTIGLGGLGIYGLMSGKKKKKDEPEDLPAVKQADASELYLNQIDQYRNRFKDRLLGAILGGTGGGMLGTLAGGILAAKADASPKAQALAALLGGALGTGLGGWGGKSLADTVDEHATRLAVEDEINREKLRSQLREEGQDKAASLKKC